MGTPFEDYIGANMPLKGSLLTPVSCGGYDGDPNDPGAPAILVGAPAGTKYVETTAQKIWEKGVDGTWSMGADLSAVDQDIVPDADVTRKLGSVVGGVDATRAEFWTFPAWDWSPFVSGLEIDVSVNGAPAETLSFWPTSVFDAYGQFLAWLPTVGLEQSVGAWYGYRQAPVGDPRYPSQIEAVRIYSLPSGSDESLDFSVRGVFGDPWLSDPPAPYPQHVEGTDAVAGSEHRWLQSQDLLPDVSGMRTIGRLAANEVIPEFWFRNTRSMGPDWPTNAKIGLCVDETNELYLDTPGTVLTTAQIAARWQAAIVAAGLDTVLEAVQLDIDTVRITSLESGSAGARLEVLYYHPPSTVSNLALSNTFGEEIQYSTLPAIVVGQAAVTKLSFKEMAVDNLAVDKARFVGANADPSADGALPTILDGAFGGITIGCVSTFGTGTATLVREGDNLYAPNFLAANAVVDSGGEAVIENAIGGAVVFGSVYATDGHGEVSAPAASGAWGAFCQGYAAAVGSGGAALLTVRASAAFAQGYTTAWSDADALIEASGFAAFAQGYATAWADGVAHLRATSYGSFAQGNVRAQGYGGTPAAYLESMGAGSFAQGAVTADSTNTAWLRATGSGSFAQGQVTGSPSGTGLSNYIEASADGAFAQGIVSAYNDDAHILASGFGASAMGTAGSYYSAVGGFIEATADGTRAQGIALDGSIKATAVGASAFGYADGFNVEANGVAAFAYGHAETAAVIANGVGSWQIGQGTNPEDHCVGFGTAFRFLQIPDDAFATPANGDMRVMSNAVEIRSNGVNVTFNQPSVTGSRGGNAALASLLTQLAAIGIITDGTTA
jgi:hypothetical protein